MEIRHLRDSKEKTGKLHATVLYQSLQIDVLAHRFFVVDLMKYEYITSNRGGFGIITNDTNWWLF